MKDLLTIWFDKRKWSSSASNKYRNEIGYTDAIFTSTQSFYKYKILDSNYYCKITIEKNPNGVSFVFGENYVPPIKV